MRYTILSDRHAHAPDLKTEHGLSILIEHDGSTILFDTGNTDVALSNAKQLGISFDQLTAVVLSHGHYDHTGGLVHFDSVIPESVPIYAHRDVLLTRYSRHADGSIHEIGMPPESRDVIKHRKKDMVWVSRSCEIAAGIWLTGPIMHLSPFEDTGGDFWLDEACSKPDRLDDDLALWIREPKGITVFCGCAHAGVVNTIAMIRIRNPHTPICAVIGGMHLKNASPTRLQATISYLESCGVDELRPLHCSGDMIQGWNDGHRLWE